MFLRCFGCIFSKLVCKNFFWLGLTLKLRLLYYVWTATTQKNLTALFPLGTESVVFARSTKEVFMSYKNLYVVYGFLHLTNVDVKYKFQWASVKWKIGVFVFWKTHLKIVMTPVQNHSVEVYEDGWSIGTRRSASQENQLIQNPH